MVESRFLLVPGGIQREVAGNERKKWEDSGREMEVKRLFSESRACHWKSFDLKKKANTHTAIIANVLFV